MLFSCGGRTGSTHPRTNEAVSPNTTDPQNSRSHSLPDLELGENLSTLPVFHTPKLTFITVSRFALSLLHEGLVCVPLHTQPHVCLTAPTRIYLICQTRTIAICVMRLCVWLVCEVSATHMAKIHIPLAFGPTHWH